MLSGLTGWHLLIILAIVVFIFGAAKLPGLAKSVGQSMKIFKNEIKPEDKPADPPAAAGPQLNQTSAEVQAQTDAPKSKS
ncbi:MAG: preprotein translocase [Microbacteriaceae bacterium]|nr:preprotein translocase [Microbacteriaceae bacterium]